MPRVPGRFTRCRLGVAVRDVTPPVGIYHRSWGAATHDLAEGVHRPLTTTAAVFAPLDGAGPTLALVALDYGWFQRPEDGEELLQAVRERAGLGEEAVLISLSHTHAGANATSALADRPGGHLIKPFLARLADQVSAAVAEARERTEPAWISWGYGRCVLASNRDFWDPEAGRWACGYNPDPPEPPDDTLLVGRATRDDGSTVATLFNYACHPTTLAWANRQLSPDWVGAAREVLERAFDGPAIFLQGAAGELEPRECYVGDTAVADRNGRVVGHAAVAAIEGLPPAGRSFAYTGIVESGAVLGTWAWQPASDAELAGASTLSARLDRVDIRRKGADLPETIEAAIRDNPSGPELEKLTRRLLLVRSMGAAEIYAFPIWTWRLGQATLVSTPHELYSSFQREVRRAAGDTPVLVLGDTNGWLGYLSPAETYGQGLYQEWQSPFEPGCLERVTEAAKGLVATHM